MKRLFITLFVLLFTATFAYSAVTVNNLKPVDDTKNWIYLTLTVDGDVCRYVSVNPWNTSGPVLSGAALSTYANGREAIYALNILKSMYPNARPTERTLESFQAWIDAGHTNPPYCKKGRPYCTTQPIPAYCEDGTPYCSNDEYTTQQTCETAGMEWVAVFDAPYKCAKAGGTWHTLVPRPSNQETCVESEGTWVTVFDTEDKCTLAQSQWIPEETITKVPWVDSHNFTGDLRTRKLEQLNAAQTAYIADHYDQGTQASFTALFVLPTTPQAVKDALLPVWTWIQSVTTYYYGKKVAIRNGEDWDSVTWDFTQFDASDPHVSLEALME